MAHEIEILKECDCPQIVRYFGSFRFGDQLWIVMEYCEVNIQLTDSQRASHCAAAHSRCSFNMITLGASPRAGIFTLGRDGGNSQALTKPMLAWRLALIPNRGDLEGRVVCRDPEDLETC